MQATNTPEFPFRVFLLGRAGLVYERDGMFACIDGEGLAGQPCRYVIVADSITQWDYPVRIPIDREQRATIIEDIRGKFERENCELVVEEKDYEPRIASAYHERIADPMLRQLQRDYGCLPKMPSAET